MLQEVSDESMQSGLKMNIAKKKVMVVYNTQTNVYNVLIEDVEGCVTLAQHIVSLGQGSEPGQRNTTNNNNNIGRNDSFYRGWLPHRGEAQMAYK